MLREMLELATTVRLVVLNACSLSEMGSQLCAAGVPHVVCCSADLKETQTKAMKETYEMIYYIKYYIILYYIIYIFIIYILYYVISYFIILYYIIYTDVCLLGFHRTP